MKELRISRLVAVSALVLTLAAAIQAQTFSVVYNFGDVPKDASFPQYSGIIAQGRDGSLYGTTAYGGENDYGTVFKVTRAGQVSVLYNFNNTDPDEAFPFSGLALGADGNFYGTTFGQLENSTGKVFKVTPTGQVTFLHTFAAGEGRQAYAPPILATDGNLYGTTALGGDAGQGTVYRITPSGQFKTIASFSYTDGYYPIAPLIEGTDGDFYGTTWEGGALGVGTAFKVTGKGKITTLHSFKFSDGAYPRAPLVQGSDGNLYGVADGGGDNSFGVVFRVSPTKKFKVLHSFAASDGEYSSAGLAFGSDGNFYGSTYGSTNLGTLYRITPDGNFAVVHAFDMTHGGHPEVTMTQHTTGTLYGDTFNGGVHGYGTIYSLDASLPAFAKLVTFAGKVGDSIGILGQGFTGTTAVSFNGTAASFQIVSDTFLTANVPDGATTGPVTVSKGTKKLVSNQSFLVMPVIASVSPASGKVGSLVTITGVSLSQTTEVKFGSTTASFTVKNDKQITATVPVGAKTGKITVTTPGGIATSAKPFAVTP